MAHKIRRVPGTVLSVRTIREVRRYKVWDCSSCGRKGFNAKKCHQCVGCGNSKDASDNEQRSATEVDANYEHIGADVTCQHCGTENVARFSCKQCGAALDKKFEDIVKQFPSTADQSWRAVHVQADDQGFVPGATETPWNDGSEPVVLEEPVPDIELPPPPPTPDVQSDWNPGDAVIEAEERARRHSQERDKRLQDYSVIFAVVLGVIGIIGMYVYNQLYSFTPTTAQVSAVSWTYSLPLEDYAERERFNDTEDYSWTPPESAHDVDRELAFVRNQPIYDDVWVEKTCTKNVDNSYDDTDGTWVEKIDEVTYDCSGYETQVVGTYPVYEVEWSWKVMAWEQTTPLTARGDSHVVTYPTFTPTSTLRQAGVPTTTFTVRFSYTDDDNEVNTATRTYPRVIWEKAQVGRAFDALVDGFDRLQAVSGLDPNYEELTK